MINSNSMLSTFVGDSSSVGAVKSPVGPLQGVSALFFAQPTSSTIISTIGGTLTGAGTVSHVAITPTATNFTRFRRMRSTGGAGAGAAGGFYTGYVRWFRGTNGGFDTQITFGLGGVNTTGYSAFAGISTIITAMTATDVTTLTDCLGIGFSAADANSGEWSLVYNDAGGAATKTAIAGMTRSTTDGYILRITAPKAGTTAVIAVYNAHSGATILAPTTISSNLPSNNTLLSVGAQTYNGAVAASAILDVASIAVTCDY